MTSSVEVEGRTVPLPMPVRDASVGTAMFPVDVAAAAALLPEGLVPVRVSPRHALLTLVMVQYRDTAIGSYHEAAVQVAAARPRLADRVLGIGDLLRGRPSTWTVAMPVDDQFSLDAGQQVWGFPKTLDEVRTEIRAGRATSTWHADGQHVWTLSVPTGTGRAMPVPPLEAWTVKDGRLHRTAFTMGARHGRVGLGGARLELGSHPTARRLAAMGLPRRALLTTWLDDMQATFGPPRAA